MAGERLRSFWDSYARYYVRLQLSPVYQRLLAKSIEKAAIGEGDRCLDLGCGPGHYAEAMYQAGGNVWAVDYCDAMLSYAEERFADIRRGDRELHIVRRDVEDYLRGTADASFDVVMASLFLSYIPNPETILGHVHRVLRPGGRLVMSNPVPDARFVKVFLRSGWAAIRHLYTAIRILCYALRIQRMAREGRFRFFSEEETVSMLAAQGFDPAAVQIERAFADTAFITTAQKTAG